MMKKILFTVAVLALLVSVSSCTKEKEGKYAPKEKINAVYLEQQSYYGGTLETQNPKYKSEEWTWVDDRLDRILYYDQYSYEDDETGEVVSSREQIYVQLFSYDDKDRLVKSEILGYANMEAVLEYDGNYLKTMTVYDEQEMLVKYQFNHDGKKITSFDLTLGDMWEDIDKKTVRQLEVVSPLRFVLGDEPMSAMKAATKSCVKRAVKVGSKGGTVLHFDMEWVGDNVTRIATSYMGAMMRYDFNYDDKNNPFYNLFEIVNTVESGFIPFMPLSRNNVTGIAQTESDGEQANTETTVYTYTYNKKDYPISKTLDETEDDYRYVVTYYYDYRY